MTSPFCVVDGISEPWRVYDGEPQFDSFLLNANGVFDDGDCSTDPLCKRTQFVQRRMRSHTRDIRLCVYPPNTESEKLILTFSIENFSVLVKIREEQTVD